MPALILAIGILFLPESPRWLMEKDKQEEALTTLRRLHYNGHNDDFINLEFTEIQNSIHAAGLNGKVSWTDIMKNPSWRRRLLLGCSIQAFGQLSGINGMSFMRNKLWNVVADMHKSSIITARVSTNH